MNRNAAIVDAARLPFQRTMTGYNQSDPIDLATQLVAGMMARSRVPEELLDEIILGCVVPPSQTSNLAREVVFRAGLSPRIPGLTIARACASGLSGLALATDGIRSGTYKTVLVGGVEGLSRAPIPFDPAAIEAFAGIQRSRGLPARLKKALSLRPRMFLPREPRAIEPSTGLTMGEHAEIMAKTWGISRDEQDDYAFRSHQKADRALAEARVPGPVLPAYGGKRSDQPILEDNGVRRPPDREALRKLKPAFDKVHGTLTAGNSTFLTDGAGALMVMEENLARSLGFPFYLVVRGHRHVAMDPGKGLLMAPPRAIHELLVTGGLAIADIAAFEIHEAFAAQVLANLKAMDSDAYGRDELGHSGRVGSIDPEKMNRSGGSLAIGHPFAATGPRLLMGLLEQLRSVGGGLGLASACAAGAMAEAILVEGVKP